MSCEYDQSYCSYINTQCRRSRSREETGQRGHILLPPAAAGKKRVERGRGIAALPSRPRSNVSTIRTCDK